MDRYTIDEQELIDRAKQFSDEKLRPIARALDEENRFPSELLPEMAQAGFFGARYPCQYGGLGFSTAAAERIATELARGSAGVALTFHVHWMAADAILKFGTDEQKQRWLPDLISGKRIAAYTISEVGAGSDAASMQATATACDGGYQLNGIKYFSTNGGLSDLLVLALKTAPDQGSKGISVFVVDRASKGLEVGPNLSKMGCRSSNTTSVILKDCFVPAENLLGKENGGFKVAMYGLVGGRLGMCSMGIGIAEACLAEAASYANRRIAFGKPIAALYSVQEMVAEMHVKLEAARLLVTHVAARMDTGADCAVDTSIAKLFVAETVDEVCHKALQIFGGHGYIKSCNVERYARDGRLMDIGVGTSEVLKMVVGGAVLRANS